MHVHGGWKGWGGEGEGRGKGEEEEEEEEGYYWEEHRRGGEASTTEAHCIGHLEAKRWIRERCVNFRSLGCY